MNEVLVVFVRTEVWTLAKFETVLYVELSTINMTWNKQAICVIGRISR